MHARACWLCRSCVRTGCCREAGVHQHAGRVCCPWHSGAHSHVHDAGTVHSANLVVVNMHESNSVGGGVRTAFACGVHNPI